LSIIQIGWVGLSGHAYKSTQPFSKHSLREKKNGNQFWIDRYHTHCPVFSCHLPGKLRMEAMVLFGLVLTLLVIVTVDTRQKRRKYLDEGK
jgi:hypothetical protein